MRNFKVMNVLEFRTLEHKLTRRLNYIFAKKLLGFSSRTFEQCRTFVAESTMHCVRYKLLL